MTLDIIVPHYKETTEVIKPLLDSIALQQNVDFKIIKVTIVDDGFDCTEIKLNKENYPYEITHLKMPKGGVSAARQYGIDNTNGDYIIICDCDDMFHSNVGLWLVLNEAKKSNFDFMISNFIEESRTPDKKEIVYIPHEIDATFVHGKVYQRKFLDDNKIKWNKNLTIHEDSYFNILCQRLQKHGVHCPMPFYLWKWRDESVCRHDDKYMLKTFSNMLDSSSALVNEFMKRNRLKDAAEIVVQMVVDSYLTMNKKEWLDQENQEYRISTERRFKTYWNDHKDLWNGTPENIKNQIIVLVKNRMFQEGVILENITFGDWIKHIEEL